MIVNIIPPFGQRQMLYPFMLLVRGEAPQIGLQAFSHCFCLTIGLRILTIGLRMLSCNQLELFSLELENFQPKFSNESVVVIRHNRSRHAMQFEYLVHENLSYQCCSKWVQQTGKILRMEIYFNVQKTWQILLVRNELSVKLL